MASEFSRKDRGYVARAAGQHIGGTRYTPRFGIEQLRATHPRGKMDLQKLATFLGPAGNDATRTTPFFRGDRWVAGELGFCDGAWQDAFALSDEGEGGVKDKLKEAWHLYNASQHFGEFIIDPQGMARACQAIETLKPQTYATTAKLQKRHKQAIMMLQAGAATDKYEDAKGDVSVEGVVSVEEQIAKRPGGCGAGSLLRFLGLPAFARFCNVRFRQGCPCCKPGAK